MLFLDKELHSSQKFCNLNERYQFVFLQWSICMNALNMVIINCTHSMCTQKYVRSGKKNPVVKCAVGLKKEIETPLFISI